MFIYVLCEVATVSQLCISFPYLLHGLCEDYLTCDIAFNAVMPLSRASTRGRYSRIDGITLSQRKYKAVFSGNSPVRPLKSQTLSSAPGVTYNKTAWHDQSRRSNAAPTPAIAT